MKTRHRHILVFAAVFLCFMVTAHADEFDYDPLAGAARVSVITYSSYYVKDAFGEKGGEANAYLYRVRLAYIPEDGWGNKDVVSAHLERMVFELSEASGLTPASAGEMRLVVDTNGNQKPDLEDRVVARTMIDLNEKKISFILDEKLSQLGQDFFLIGDFPRLYEKTEVRIRLYGRLLIVREEGVQKSLPVSGSSYAEVWHREGNTPPVLTYSSIKDGNNGVAPVSGRSGDLFTFEVMYNDRDGDPPGRVELWIDLDEDGLFGPDEKFPMQSVNSYDSIQVYRTTRIIIPTIMGKIAYRFFADDGKDEATGPAIGVSVFMVQAALIIRSVETPHNEIVPGEKFEVRYMVRYLFESVRIDWESAGKNDVAPFVFLHAIHKGRRAVSLFHDEEMLVVALQAPSSLLEGAIEVPRLILTSRWYDSVRKTEVPLESIAPKTQLQIVPLRARIEVNPSRARGTIGDMFEVKLAVVKKPDVEVVSSPIEEWKFPPFTIYTPLVFEQSRQGEIEVRSWHAVLEAFMATGAKERIYEIPGYIFEYQVAGEPKLRNINLAAVPVTLNPVLTLQELQGPPLIFPRLALAQSLFGPLARQAAWVRGGMVVVVLVTGGVLLWQVFLFLYRVISQDRSWRAYIARWNWISLVRLMEYHQGTLPPRLLIQGEQAFRRYLAYVFDCSEAEAQSVFLWEKIEKESSGKMVPFEDIRICLRLFALLGESHGGEEERKQLVVLQKKLRAIL